MVCDIKNLIGNWTQELYNFRHTHRGINAFRETIKISRHISTLDSQLTGWDDFKNCVILSLPLGQLPCKREKIFKGFNLFFIFS